MEHEELTDKEIHQLKKLLKYDTELLELAEQIHARSILAKVWGKRVIWTATIITAVILLRDSIVSTVKGWLAN